MNYGDRWVTIGLEKTAPAFTRPQERRHTS
nr:MAG TPA: hypothetical protein [Caudoviricetes sp.]